MGKWIRVAVLTIIAGFFIALFVFNSSQQPSNDKKVWDMATTTGNKEAKNLYVMNTDLACPYCDVFSRLIMENQEDFDKFIADNDILYEVRVTEFLYENGEHKPDMSRWSAKGIHCATKQNKFWEYYKAGIKALWDDYHSKGIGVSKTAPKIEGMEETYWTQKVAKAAGVDNEEFQTCYKDEATLKAVQDKTAKMAKTVPSGLPYFVFNKWTQSGFDQSWDYSYVKQYLESGLSSK